MGNNFFTDKAKQMTVDEWHQMVLDGKTDVVVRVTPKGMSMMPLIRGGEDSVLIYPLRRPPVRGDIVLFRRSDGANVLHRVYKTAADLAPDGIKSDEMDDWRSCGQVQTLGDGCVSPDAPVDISKVWGIATVLKRDGKEYNLDSSVARFQGILWQKLLWTRKLKMLPRRVAHKVVREWLGIKKK